MNTHHRRRLLFALLLLGTLPVGCKKGNDPAATAACSIASFRTTEGSGGVTTYSYDSKGQLSKIVFNGGYGHQYTYNADGYLVQQTKQLANGNAAGTAVLEYTNGQLIRQIDRDAAGQLTSKTTYFYQPGGHLREAVSVEGNTSYTYQFAGGKQTGYTARNLTTSAESQPYTFKDGRIGRALNGLSVNSYEYDAQGRCIRREISSTGRLSVYYTYEYTDGQHEWQASYRFKGAPVEMHNLNDIGMGRGLATKQTIYVIPTTGSTYRSGEIIWTYTKNSSGFPLERNYSSQQYNPNGTPQGAPTTFRNTYTYEGCPN